MYRGCVLVVDDLPDVRDTVSGILSDAGYVVCSVSDRMRALAELGKRSFDAAILDVRLDETDDENKDGLVLMHEIKEKYPSIAVIILTGYADVQMVKEALQPASDGVSPAYGFLEKHEINQLVEWVERATQRTASGGLQELEHMISCGENERVEFKSSMRWDRRTGSVNKDLQKAVAVTIAGMLNSDGGTLLIGISDDGTVLGLEKDLQTLRKANVDSFLLALTDVVTHYLGMECMANIHPRFETLEQKVVCIVSIDPSPAPVYLNAGGEYEFWLRVTNSTRSLHVKDAIDYIARHWK